ncbi:MAG: hypothetical protein ACK4YV_07715 [Emticicia sp.]
MKTLSYNHKKVIFEQKQALFKHNFSYKSVIQAVFSNRTKHLNAL